MKKPRVGSIVEYKTYGNEIIRAVVKEIKPEFAGTIMKAVVRPIKCDPWDSNRSVKLKNLKVIKY